METITYLQTQLFCRPRDLNGYILLVLKDSNVSKLSSHTLTHLWMFREKGRILRNSKSTQLIVASGKKHAHINSPPRCTSKFSGEVRWWDTHLNWTATAAVDGEESGGEWWCCSHGREIESWVFIPEEWGRESNLLFKGTSAVIFEERCVLKRNILCWRVSYRP